MKNLIKNVLRSFRKNKISIIGLIFLLFFGLGAYCIMSNTTANISNEYTSLAEKGKLHDLNANELYELGTPAFNVEGNRGFKLWYTTSGWNATYLENLTEQDHAILTSELWNTARIPEAEQGNTYYFILPEQEIVNSNAIRKYHVKLDANSSTGLFKTYAESQQEYYDFDIVMQPETATEYYPAALKDVIDYIDNPEYTKEQKELRLIAYATESASWLSEQTANILAHDLTAFNQGIEKQSTAIQSVMTTKDTPLSLEIDEKYSNELEYKFFRSINVTSAGDGIFYKIIESNPTDSIDKMVLFKDRNDRYGNNLYKADIWAPYGSEIKFYDLYGKLIPAGTEIKNKDKEDVLFTIPATYDEAVLDDLETWDTVKTWDWENQYIYSQLVHIRFKRMFAGEMTGGGAQDLAPIIKDLAAVKADNETYFVDLFFSTRSSVRDHYNQYINEYQSIEARTLSTNGNVVYQYNALTPFSLTITNWSVKLAIINPQHLENSDKYVLAPEILNNFVPYREWHRVVYGEYPKNTDIDSIKAAAWFNSLNISQFNFWIKPTVEKMTYVLPDLLSTEIVINNSEWKGVPQQYITELGGFNLINWGCGLTPDFMYPVVDITRPTPNPKTECLTYVNSISYKAIKLTYLNSQVEEYLVAKFKPSVNSIRQDKIIDELNKFCSEHMMYPKSVKAIYRADDANNMLNPSGYRISYIPSLVGVIDLVSIILCTFLAILALIICLVIIKRYVENNRINIGIMRANGIKKRKIALSLFPFALIPAVIGGVAAYLLGLFLQIPALSLFKNYWMLPTPIIGFSWPALLICIFGPFLIFSLISFVATMFVLRTKSVELMKAGSEFKTNGFSRVVKKPFKYFGVLTRFRVSLAFNSLSRLVMLGVMSCLTMSSLVFTFTTFDKLATSQRINSSQFDYSFSIKLTSPTTSGGTYNVEDYSAVDENGNLRGLGYSDAEQFIYNTYWSTQATEKVPGLVKSYANPLGLVFSDDYIRAVGKNGNIMMPSISDANGKSEDLMYLQNKVLSKATLDYTLGIGTLSSNPWEIALALMPLNARNIANDSYNTIINDAGHKVFAVQSKLQELIGSEGPYWYSGNLFDAYNKLTDAEKKWAYPYYAPIEIIEPLSYNVLPTFFSASSPDAEGNVTYTLNPYYKSVLAVFGASFAHLLKTMLTDEDIMRKEYPVMYGILPLNYDKEPDARKDEQYTYVEGTLSNISSIQSIYFDPSHVVTIEGIKQDSQYIKLTDKKNNNLNQLLYDEAERLPDDVYPLVVNAYSAHKYNLRVGDTFTLTAENTADRFERKIHPDKFNEDSKQAKYKVVGISLGTNGEAFYTTQNAANKHLGLPDGNSWNKTHKYMRYERNVGIVVDDIQAGIVDIAGVENNDKPAIYYLQGSEPIKDPEEKQLSDFNASIPVGFNGVYTSNKDGRPITSTLPLYSYTGMCPATSVYYTDTNNQFENILMTGNNLSVANKMSAIDDKTIYQKCAEWINLIDPTEAQIEAYRTVVKGFINKIRSYYGDTTVVTSIAGAMDVAASDQIYKNLISTFDLAEASVMSIIIPVTIIIVGIISNLIITDSRKMAAMLKALGYSDAKNLMSILALFVPAIFLGLALAVPLSFGLTLGYQSIIFNTANILVDVTQKWWYYISALAGIGVILLGTYGIGYASIKKSRLVDEIK